LCPPVGIRGVEPSTPDDIRDIRAPVHANYEEKFLSPPWTRVSRARNYDRPCALAAQSVYLNDREKRRALKLISGLTPLDKRARYAIFRRLSYRANHRS
jgi:hypothetical protein